MSKKPKRMSYEEFKKRTKFTYKDGKDFDLEQFTALIEKMSLSIFWWKLSEYNIHKNLLRL